MTHAGHIHGFQMVSQPAETGMPISILMGTSGDNLEGLIEANGALCLFGLLQPLFDLQSIWLLGTTLPQSALDRESGARTRTVARRLVALLRAGQIGTAVELARSRYAMARTFLAKADAPWAVHEPERQRAVPAFDGRRVYGGWFGWGDRSFRVVGSEIH